MNNSKVTDMFAIENIVYQIESVVLSLSRDDRFDTLDRNTTAGVLSATEGLIHNLRTALSEYDENQLSVDKPKPVPSNVEETKKLRGQIEWIDCLSQDGFSHIHSAARLALKAMKSPLNTLDLEMLADAFELIQEKADMIKDCITAEADQVGRSYKDDDRIKRRETLRVVA